MPLSTVGWMGVTAIFLQYKMAELLQSQVAPFCSYSSVILSFSPAHIDVTNVCMFLACMFGLGVIS